MKPLAEVLLDLRAPVEKQHVLTKSVPMKKGGTYEADYIQHATLRDLLDERAPGWESDLQITHAAGRIYVHVGLTIHGSDGSVTRWNVGNERDDLDGYGDPSSNGHAMGLGRVAMDFGLGRDLWMKKKKHQAARTPGGSPAPARSGKRQPRTIDADDYR